MDPKKKKIYIAIIVVCVILTAIVLVFGLKGSSSPAAPQVPKSSLQASLDQADQTAATRTSPLKQSEVLPPPPVFPLNNTFNTAVLDSDKFKELQPYQPATIDPATELGRPDPFKTY